MSSFSLEEHVIIEKRIKKALKGYNAGIYEWNMIDNSAYYSPEWIEMLGFSNGSNVPPHLSTWANLVHPDDLEEIMLNVNLTVKSKKQNIETVHRLKHKDGQWIWILGRGLIEYDEKGSAIRMTGIHTNITQQQLNLIAIHETNRKEKEALNYKATHDVLTGLPNRLLFHDRLQMSIEKAKRNNSKIALFFLDIDNFKKINDSLGHEVGDIILQVVANRIRKLLRKQDTFARLGGDEFTLIIEDLTEYKDASDVATKILYSLNKLIIANNIEVSISCSIGISTYPDDSESDKQLLKYADIAMYVAKENGRNNFQYYKSTISRNS